MPPEYKNTRFLKSQTDRAVQLRYMVKKFKPRLIYYNTFKMPPVEDILPDNKVKPLMVLDDPSPFYANLGDIKYSIYEVRYQREEEA